jgi:hypothetical protein
MESCYPAAIELVQENQKKLGSIPCELDKYLLSDSFDDKPEPGAHFDKSLENVNKIRKKTQDWMVVFDKQDDQGKKDKAKSLLEEIKNCKSENLKGYGVYTDLQTRKKVFEGLEDCLKPLASKEIKDSSDQKSQAVEVNKIDLEKGLMIYFFETDTEFEAKSIDDDRSKVTVVYAQMHRHASENPDDEVIFDFYDDQDKILDAVLHFYGTHTDLMPRNLTLRLYKYDGTGTPSFQKIIYGGGAIDQNYHINTRILIDFGKSYYEYREAGVGSDILNQKIVEIATAFKKTRIMTDSDVRPKLKKESKRNLEPTVFPSLSIGTSTAGFASPFSKIKSSVGPSGASNHDKKDDLKKPVDDESLNSLKKVVSSACLVIITGLAQPQ